LKKVLSFVVMGVLALTLAGCVQVDDTPYEVDCEQYPTHPSCLTDINPDDPEGLGIINVLDSFPTEDVQITFWHVYGQSKAALLDQLIAEFEEMHPNVTIESVSQGNYTDILDATGKAILADGDMPTIIIGYPDHVAEYLKAGAVIPLDDFIKSDTWGVDLNDFPTSYLEENSQYANGLYYSFPYSKSTEMMVYNKDIIEAHATEIEAALGEPFPSDRPLTWAELDLLAPILVDPNFDLDNPTANMCQYLINYDSAANFFINNVRMWGGGYTNSAGEILVDDPVTRDMLAYVQTRFENKTMAIPLAWGEDYGSTNFIAGDICFSVGSTAGINYNIPVDGSFEVGVAPIPQYDVDNMSAVQQGPNISIMEKTTDAERLVAWEFIKYLINPENTAAWAMDTGYLPTRLSGYNSDEYQAFLAIDDINNSKYYSSLAAQAAQRELDYQDYDPAFSAAYSSSDARDQANLAMEALFGGYSVDDVISYMLQQLGQ